MAIACSLHSVERRRRLAAGPSPPLSPPAAAPCTSPRGPLRSCSPSEFIPPPPPSAIPSRSASGNPPPPHRCEGKVGGVELQPPPLDGAAGSGWWGTMSCCCCAKERFGHVIARRTDSPQSDRRLSWQYWPSHDMREAVGGLHARWAMWLNGRVAPGPLGAVESSDAAWLRARLVAGNSKSGASTRLVVLVGIGKTRQVGLRTEEEMKINFFDGFIFQRKDR
mmetsp:Transcript_54103/g.113114  ORF Transcript_54103/g.113114 Transcript_54103/m.113114 type:complete len:222 (-) Transcript_54103:106-771(-)